MTHPIGIDLGTTNSLVTYWNGEAAVPIKNAQGAALTPSAVSIDDQGELHIGQAAYERRLLHPDQTALSFKRYMGMDRSIRVGRKDYRPEELSALILKTLKQDAEQELGTEVTSAVISVPAYFGEAQRQATMAAAALAGLEVKRLVNEPTAAALAYGLTDEAEGQYLVLDLGGGTFDVSLLEKFDDILEIRATAGDNQLGGDDFTEALHDHFAKDLEGYKDTPANRAALMRVADEVKRGLAVDEAKEFSATIEGQTQTFALTRDQAEEIWKPLLARITRPIERTIRDAQIDLSELDAIVLVGGSTRLHCFRRLVTRLFGKLPLMHLNPDELVGLGAAVQSGLIDRDGALQDKVMTDVCPHTLGIETIEDPNIPGGRTIMAPLIMRNATVPVSHTEYFNTLFDNQEQLGIKIYQGESRRPEDNLKLGQIDAKIPRKPAGEAGVSVTFTLDINGVLHVEVEEPTTKKVMEETFKQSGGILTEREVKQLKSKLAELKIPPREQQANKALLNRADHLYQEADAKTRQVISHRMSVFESKIADQLNRHPERDRKDFEEFLDSIEASLHVFDG